MGAFVGTAHHSWPLCWRHSALSPTTCPTGFRIWGHLAPDGLRFRQYRWTARCAQATGELHHPQVDTGTSGCIYPFGSTPTRSPIHLAPHRLLLDARRLADHLLGPASSAKLDLQKVRHDIDVVEAPDLASVVSRSHTFRRLHRRSRLDIARKVHASPAR